MINLCKNEKRLLHKSPTNFILYSRIVYSGQLEPQRNASGIFYYSPFSSKLGEETDLN